VTRSTVLLILANVAMTSLAQIILKLGMSSPEIARVLSGGIRFSGLVTVLLHPWVISGLVLYFAAALVWLLVLSKVDVSLAYPFVGLGFVVTMVLAWTFLGEAVTAMRMAGTLLVAAGVLLLAMH
jgi:multidrug transporter EmrE-like cation transporter